MEELLVEQDDGSERSGESPYEIPMEMDLTQSGQPISEDGSFIDVEKKNKWIKFGKPIAKRVGLVIVLFSYLFIGATIFRAIEGPNEIIQRDKELGIIFGLRDDFQNHIWNITQDTENRISREAFNSINQEYFDKLVKNMFISYRNQYISEHHLTNGTKNGPLWTFPNSVFFATTVITTIGYGNIVPTTTLGRVACIIFALFGIPLLLVTIADIGRLLSNGLRYLHQSFQLFKKKIRRQSRRISHHYRSTSHSRASEGSSSKAGSMNLSDIESDSEHDSQKDKDENELKIPVFVVLFVLLAYTAVGAFLFQSWEGLPYFEAFYFCFITMATVGFGDIVPTEQVYMFFTMAYIIFGLSLATMCIDLAGMEYIKRMKDLGKKMEDAKGTVITGLQVGEQILKHTGIEVIKTAGGKLIQVRGAVLNSRQARELGVDYILADLQYQHRNILYEPLSSNVKKLVEEKNIKILPDEITEKDGYIVQNKSYDLPATTERGYVRISGNIIHRVMVPSLGGPPLIVPCLLYRESNL